MNGKIAAASIVITAFIAGIAIWYLQIYAFYKEVTFPPGQEITVTKTDGQTAFLPLTEIEGIDATSSPLRFRACFRTGAPAEDYAPYAGAEPLVAPGWFSCFDAMEIGTALEAGTAKAYLSRANIAENIDRVIAVFPDGRAYAWHQINPAAKD